MLVVRATLPIDPDRMDEAVDLARDLAAAPREEAGVLEYLIAEDLESAGVLRCYEVTDVEPVGVRAQPTNRSMRARASLSSSMPVA